MFRLTNLITFRSIRVHFLRFALSGFGIVLGVAAIAGAIMLPTRPPYLDRGTFRQHPPEMPKLTIASGQFDSDQGFPEQVQQTVGTSRHLRGSAIGQSPIPARRRCHFRPASVLGIMGPA